MTTPCPSTADLRGLVNGSLSDDQADALQLHLEKCETCQAALQELAADGMFWQSAAASLADQHADEEASGPGLERAVENLRQQSPEDAEEMGEAIELKLSFIEPPVEPGTIGRLQNYDILRVAGRGGMGIVVKAFDRSLRRVVAIKLLAPHLAGNAQARQRFVREGRAAAAICHEHVITIHAVEESPPFLVMNYVQGETLEARIHRNGSLDVREAVRIAKQIAQGLAAAHTQGVVHRDIKPANILLENGVARVRITDFGLARAVDDASLTQSGVVAGTPQYMAPEQANGDAVDERADLFSLGSVLYTMLAGHAPFRATTTMGVLKRLCDNTARPIREINPEVPEWLVMMINRLHAKRPADRYQSAQEVAAVLERGLASLQNGASPTIEFPAVDASSAATESAGLESEELPAGVRHDTFVPDTAASLGLASSLPTNAAPPGWTIPVPFWLVAIPLVLVALGPLGQEAAAIATFSLIGLCFVGMLAYFVNKLLAEPDTSVVYDSSGPKDRSAGGQLRWLAFRLREITPSSRKSKLGWLAAWCLPISVWTLMGSIQESWAYSMPVTSFDDRDRDIVITLVGVFCFWWLIAIAWFRRKRPDGSLLFERGRWLRVLTMLVFAAGFCGIGYEVWMSDVHHGRLYQERLLTGDLPNSHIRMTYSDEAPAATMVRIEFETATDGLEVVINFAGGRNLTLTPVHHQVMIQISEPPGTYEWRAMLKGQHVASGEVALIAGEMAAIKVPRPKLSQLIAGRWEADPKQKALDWGGEDDDTGEMQIELEFEKDQATLAIGESGRVERSQFTVRIDESVTPALIDLSVPDGPQMTGIVKFQAGRKSHFQMRSPYMMSSIVPGESEMMMTAESPADGSAYDEGAASQEGGMGMGFGSPGMASSSEPDQLLLCVSDGAGLRPWEFQADEARGHMLFALVRSRETGLLREKLALEPVQLATSRDLTMQSVQAWSKRLKIAAEGTNSIGMEMVLVPPAAYHLVDPPHLATLRRELPEPDSIRDSIQKDPSFDYPFPPKLKQQITKRHKSISYPFVMSRRTVTIEQFRQFIDETGYVTDAERGTTAKSASPPDTKGGWRRENGLFNWADRLSWKDPISADAEVNRLDGPVAVISWRDATEFCKWLSEKEGRQYRLPKNEEWTAAMQLGAARKPLPAANSDDPMLNDNYGWFDATSQHPLGIARSDDTFAEWTLDAQFGSKPDRMVLVHHEVSADGVRFYLGTQFTADKSFRAASVGFRVVAELQVLAAEKSDDEATSSVPEVSE